MLVLTLPWPPSTNHSHYNLKGGRRILSDTTRRFRAEVRSRYYEPVSRFTGPVQINIILSPPDKRRRDIDNPIKQILDALQDANVLEDDNQVNILTIERGAPVKPGRVLVTIESISTL